MEIGLGMLTTIKPYDEARVIESQPDVVLDRLMRETRALRNPPTYVWKFGL